MSDDKQPLQAIRWDEDALLLLDQRALPISSVWLRLGSWVEVAWAIRVMVVRGAPAIAIAGAYGLALAVQEGADRAVASAGLLAARPTAVNLRAVLERLAMLDDEAVLTAACAEHALDVANNRALGQAGVALLQDALASRNGVLTICNTGSLATGGHGTALGMVRSALAAGVALHVFALETRPYLQGARLTAHECLEDGIPCTLITDGMAGALLATGQIGACVIGCDRVAQNGDAANKIGSLGLAVLCRHYGVPFFVAMPTDTLDRDCADGDAIPIEERDGDEVRQVQGTPIAPAQVPVWNPAFDVTPAALITAWVTEQGVWRLPFPNG